VFDRIRLPVFSIMYRNGMNCTKYLLYLVIYYPHPLLATVSAASFLWLSWRFILSNI